MSNCDESIRRFIHEMNVENGLTDAHIQNIYVREENLTAQCLAPDFLRWGDCANDNAGGFWYNNCYRAGVTVMKGLRPEDFSWYGLPSTVGKELKSASMWLTC